MTKTVCVKLNRRANVGIPGLKSGPKGSSVEKIRDAVTQRVRIPGVLLLKPGINHVPAAVWAEAKDDKYVRALMGEMAIEPRGSKVLEVLAELEPAEDTATEKKDSRKGQKSAADTIKMVKELEDMGALEMMLVDETRKTVRAALEARIDELLEEKE